MRRTLATLTLTAAFVLGSVGTALANPEAPTNGGSANGGGSSGQCTGANADRPAACHNGQGSGS
jgi:hypothetical protein